MKYLSQLYQYANILSLDVVAGAVVSALFFEKLLKVAPPVNSIAALALTVWIIYTLDHLRDAMTIPKVATTDRHRFHQEHFRKILGALIAVAILDLILIGSLSAQMLRAGVGLGLVVLVYLVLQRYLKFLKEFFVACLYTAGIVLPSLSIAHPDILPIHYLIFGKFFITALMNLLLFSLFDFHEDQHQKQHSFVTWFGPGSTQVGIVLLACLNIASGFCVWAFDSQVAMVFILMNLVLLTVLFIGRRLIANNYYRILGDAVFLIPGLYLL